MITDSYCYVNNLSTCKNATKNSHLNGTQTHELCVTGAVLYQLSNQANWELVLLRVYSNSPSFITYESCKIWQLFKSTKSEKYIKTLINLCTQNYTTIFGRSLNEKNHRWRWYTIHHRISNFVFQYDKVGLFSVESTNWLPKEYGFLRWVTLFRKYFVHYHSTTWKHIHSVSR